MKRRALRKRYGRALPLVLIPLVKAGGVALTRLKSFGLAERALEPVALLGKKTWEYIGGKKKHRRHS